MATINQPVTLSFITSKDGDLEERAFAPGEQVRIIKTWDEFFLIKDDDGHYHNVKKGCVTPGDDD